MILTTTNSIEDFKITEYKGIVTGTSVNVQKMKMTFNMQKYYDAIRDSISEVKEQALQQLKDNANNLNANAVVGIKVDVELTASNYVTVTATGGTVSILKKRE